MNTYSNLTKLKSAGYLDLSGSDDDTYLLFALEYASRVIDQYCGRVFYTESATKYMDSALSRRLFFPFDVISLDTIAVDSEDDGTFDGETWVEGTDFTLMPYNEYPKSAAYFVDWRNHTPPAENYYVKLTGTFGHGDGTSAPWLALGETVTLDNATDTSPTYGTGSVVLSGMTIKAGNEQMYVDEDGELLRGVNGTTAADHTSAAVSVAKYPPMIEQAALKIAARVWNEGADGPINREQIGDYSVTNFSPEQLERFTRRMLKGYIRHVV